MARILIIDDEPQVRRMLRQMFERSGYEVVDAPNGKDAIEFHRQHPADLVITDIIMPTKEGIETIIEFKRLFQGVKVIAISGGGQVGPEAYLDVAEKVGAIRTFCKPIDRKELMETVREILS